MMRTVSKFYPWISASFEEVDEVVTHLDLACERCGAHGQTPLDANISDLSGLHAFESKHSMCLASKKNDKRKLTVQ
ncbi:MAG: hypothetical protein E6R04_11125 [Spirochaetes bacterium]|nr:MAG: hypothetical protein E6R04_11125 [Spirochaetota bacterium]